MPTCDGYEGQREFRLRAAPSMSARPSCRGVIRITTTSTIFWMILVHQKTRKVRENQFSRRNWSFMMIVLTNFWIGIIISNSSSMSEPDLQTRTSSLSVIGTSRFALIRLLGTRPWNSLFLGFFAIRDWRIFIPPDNLLFRD